MKKNIFIAYLVFLTINLIQGQNLIAVQHNGKTLLTPNIDTAINKAQSGDTIYLPGGTFKPKGFEIRLSKKIFIFGTGINTDSSNSTMITYVDASILLMNGSSNSFLQGIYLTGGITFYDSVNSVIIRDLYIGSNGIQFNGSNNNRCFKTSPLLAFNNIFINCIITESCFGGFAQNNYFLNNIFLKNISNFYSSTFKNNIFIQGYHMFLYVENCHFSNNIIIDTTGNTTFSGNYLCGSSYYWSCYNTISFNLITKQSGIAGTGSGFGNLLTNNYSELKLDSIFNIISIYPYSENKTYRLRQFSIGKNRGSDGTDIGIYGGSFPWHDGNIPFNPHIQTRFVAPITKPDGKLPVKIKVKAQNN